MGVLDWQRAGLGCVSLLAPLALGYIDTIFVVVFRRRVFGPVSSRDLFDAWLLAFPISVGASLVLLVLKLPLRFSGWDAHGVGATGGEANSLFLAWLHLAIWVLIAKRWIAS